MAKKRKSKRKVEQLRLKIAEENRLQECRELAKVARPILEEAGIHFKFFDHADSYVQKFRQIADDAIRDHASLLGVHLVGNEFLDEPKWAELGYTDLIPLNIDANDTIGYGDVPRAIDRNRINIRGTCNLFRGKNAEINTIILVPQYLGATKTLVHPEQKASMRIGTLYHEIGHVNDVENEINFNFESNTYNVLEAEVYANIYLLEQLSNNDLWFTYSRFREIFEEHAINAETGPLYEISRRVLDAASPLEPRDWMQLSTSALRQQSWTT